ncbi:MAG: ABC transporter permease [Phycisphaerae bacterium]|nr:ABC transporter permease [Phycisphaerae bacterium]
MRLRTLYRRGLVYHWRSHLAVTLGVVAGTAALTGALLVGDSLRGSLRAAALERLGRVDYAVQSPGFFRARLADEIAAAPAFSRAFAQLGPVILERGGATHAETRAAVHDVNVLGVDGRFWELGAVTCHPDITSARAEARGPSFAGRVVVINQPLAEELRAGVGDDILLRLGKSAAISPETLLGRRDDTTVTLRLTVRGVVPAEELGAFTLIPRQALPKNAYVPLDTLQRALGRREFVNTVLVAAQPDWSENEPDRDAALQTLFQNHVTLADLGLRLRISEEHNYIAVESDTFLLPPPVEAAARDAAQALGLSTTGVLTYLANTIVDESRSEATIPYSTVTALDPASEVLQAMTLIDETTAPIPAPGEILLNEWAARELDARPGDRIRLSYYVAGPLGRLDTQHTTFNLRGVVRLAGAAADPGFTPAYPGVTDAHNLVDWDPPFLIDLRLIREQDEAYWDKYRTVPKAFISWADGERLWAGEHERFGRLTSLRVHPAASVSLTDTRVAFERELLPRLDLSRLGFQVEAVRARALAASHGSTDFAGLFVGFSFFLIISAALLVALLFRLGVERRASEVGLLLATGFPRRRIGRLLLFEGVCLAAMGSLIGLFAARGYAWLMLAGLRSWWVATVKAPFLQLHAVPTSYLIGYIVSLVVAVVSIAWSLRGVTRKSPWALLAGVVESGRLSPGLKPAALRVSSEIVVAMLATVLAGALIVLSILTDLVPQTTAFFVGGTSLLIACLASLTHWLRLESRTKTRFSGSTALLRLGVRNARRHSGRSLLTAGLIAAATFNITALQAMRLKVSDESYTHESPTGGFTLLAEAAAPLPYDLNRPEGRAALNLSETAQDALGEAAFIPFRLRPGDETSCLNLYIPTQPRLLGASETMIERGGFEFAATLAESADEHRNPWTLLRRSLPDGVIPTIADEEAARWQLHLNLGEELLVLDERGREIRLRLVALLKGSILQGELIIAESRFTRHFPSIAGQAFYLIDTPAERAAEIEQMLERELENFGLAVTPTTRRLTELYAVQNTYLSTFQTLGGLGLLLGTVGLTAVLLRNIWQRRSELALLRTLGFSRITLGGLVLIENAFLVGTGLLAGFASAAVVIAPHVVKRAMPVPWGSLLLMFGAIFVAGLLAGIIALIPTLRAPLLPALRSE